MCYNELAARGFVGDPCHFFFRTLKIEYSKVGTKSSSPAHRPGRRFRPTGPMLFRGGMSRCPSSQRSQCFSGRERGIRSSRIKKKSHEFRTLNRSGKVSGPSRPKVPANRPSAFLANGPSAFLGERARGFVCFA